MTAESKITCLLTQPDNCSYLPGQISQMAFLAPTTPISHASYSQLIRMGFRRSNDNLYRPHCPECSACIPLRVPVAHFKPNRSQRRSEKKNQDISIRITNTNVLSDHFALYQRYQKIRHPGGGMDGGSLERYLDFLSCKHIHSQVIEFLLQDEVVCVSVMDVLEDALSAVYTFFEPTLHSRSLGTFSVLTQIKLARERDIPHLYLGFWIKQCAKMSYKSQFSPFEALINDHWRQFDAP